MNRTQAYLEPTQESGREFFSRGIKGRVVMLNLLRFRAAADYSSAPQLAPKAPITGEDAYRLYMEHTRPHLEKAGESVLFLGRGGKFLIGPSDERWDAAMLVSQESAAAFLAFATNREYIAVWVIASPRWKIHACCLSLKAASSGAGPWRPWSPVRLLRRTGGRANKVGRKNPRGSSVQRERSSFRSLTNERSPHHH